MEKRERERTYAHWKISGAVTGSAILYRVQNVWGKGECENERGKERNSLLLIQGNTSYIQGYIGSGITCLKESETAKVGRGERGKGGERG